MKCIILQFWFYLKNEFSITFVSVLFVIIKNTYIVFIKMYKIIAILDIFNFYANFLRKQFWSMFIENFIKNFLFKIKFPIKS